MTGITVTAIFVIFGWCQCVADFKDLEEMVPSPSGEIVGYIRTIYMDSKPYTVRTFLGIPYAEAPTGDRRFTRPVPKAKFSTPFDATVAGPICYQLNIPGVNTGYNKSEDCLLLNIYAPAAVVDGADTKPVMIFIHGGGYVWGMSNLYNGAYLGALNDIIVVTINYRLAQFGFITTGNSAALGNWGLWDQQLAIKWVNVNIHAFGGDPSKVTLFGESAGASSVVYQAMYPGNKGLFQRVIAQSGSITSPWAYGKVDKAYELTKKFSNAIGCNQHSSGDLITCLRSKSEEEMDTALNGPERANLESWRPVVDNEFVLDNPVNLLSGKSNAKEVLEMFKSVDLIIGINSKEGILDLFLWMAMLKTWNFEDVPKDKFENILVPFYLKSYYKQDISDVVVRAAIQEYTEWTDPNDDVKRANKLADLVTDMSFSVTSVMTADTHVKGTNKSTYMYKFSTRPPQHVMSVPEFMDGPGVANHADELPFVFGEMNMTGESKLVQLTVMTMWGNFAKTGNPNKPKNISIYTNTEWPQYGTEENHLEITPDMTSQSVKQRLAPKAVDFWNNLVPEILKLQNDECKYV